MSGSDERDYLDPWKKQEIISQLRVGFTIDSIARKAHVHRRRVEDLAETVQIADKERDLRERTATMERLLALEEQVSILSDALEEFNKK